MSRFDICMGYWMFYCSWHGGGLTDRCRAKGRGIAEQLSRLSFFPGMSGDTPSWEDNYDATEVYIGLIAKYHGKDRADAESKEIERTDAEACAGSA
jgi:hypothetical protein